MPSPARRDRSPVGEALHLLGDRWTLLILRDAFLTGHRRYQQWRDALEISDAVLASRLSDLVESGILSRTRYSERPPRDEYRLTRAGLELWRLLIVLWAWESRWVAGSPEAELVLVHDTCGQRTVPALVCASCRHEVGLGDVATVIGAAGREWLAAPDPVRRRSTTGAGGGEASVFRRETLEILGDRWSSIVIALAFLGVRRFSDFERSVAISPTLLSGRLRRLTALGVLEAVPSPDGSRRREYRLTDKGWAFFPAVVLLLDWADRWLAGARGTAGGPAVRITHVDCGRRLRPALGCSSCGELLERQAVHFEAAAG